MRGSEAETSDATMRRFLIPAAVLLLPAVLFPCSGWGADEKPPGRQGGRPGRAPAVVGEDDRPAFARPADGWDRHREGVPRGKMELVEYDSKTVGTKRKMNVYTPPGYDGERRYPVLYLLHGIGGDEGEWIRFAQPDMLLENLIANGKAQPMLLVMPNGRAQKDDRPVGNVMQHAPAFAVFEKDLLNDVMPAVAARYRVRSGREQSAIAGLSMGGGQALNFGLGNPDRFAWVGGFSSAPNTRPPGELLKDPAAAEKFRLIWLSCGTRDGLFGISQGVDRHLRKAGIPHVWHVTDGAHDAAEWKQALHHFLQQLKFPAE